MGVVQAERHVASDVAMLGGSTTRGFWTKRKRSATSLFAVMALLAGIAVAYKLFDQTIPNNVVRDASNFSYLITAKDLAAGETTFGPVDGADDQVIFRQTRENCTPVTGEECQVNTFPGDQRRTDVIIKNINDPKKTASWSVYVDQASIVITSWNRATNSYTTVPVSNPDYNRYLNFWKLQVDKQTYFNLPNGSSGSDYENNPEQNDSYRTSCGPAGLKELTKQSPCPLGQIKPAGTMGGSMAPLFVARPTDDRQYRFFMQEEDDGTDQSKFQGWRITFSLVFTARVPAEGESTRTSAYPVA